MDGAIAKLMPHECDVVRAPGVSAAPARPRPRPARAQVETFEQCRGFVAVKVHPTMAGYMEYRPGTHTATFVGANPLCGGRVDRAVFLVRHPMPSFWGDWQRRRTSRRRRLVDIAVSKKKM